MFSKRRTVRIIFISMLWAVPSGKNGRKKSRKPVDGFLFFCFYRRKHSVTDNNFTKGMESVLDMLSVFFCTGYGSFPPLSSLRGAWRQLIDSCLL